MSFWDVDATDVFQVSDGEAMKGTSSNLSHSWKDSNAWCTSCATGFYALRPAASDRSTCVECLGDCGRLMESQCPSGSSLVACVECDASRANASFSGGLDCATDCVNELEGACTPCDVHDSESCPAGSVYMPCGAFKDSGCVPCTNASKPRNDANSSSPSGASRLPGRAGPAPAVTGSAYPDTRRGATLVVGVVWGCYAARVQSIWDLFTV